jgi:hypothetical protein
MKGLNILNTRINVNEMKKRNKINELFELEEKRRKKRKGKSGGRFIKKVRKVYVDLSNRVMRWEERMRLMMIMN